MADIKQGPGEPGEQGHDIQQRAIDMLEQQKGQLAIWLDDVAQSVRHASHSLREQDQPTPGRYSEQAADRIEQLAGYIRKKPVHEMRQDAETYAREHPAIVLGSALVVGVLAGRFLRSSSPQEKQNQPPATIEAEETPIASRGGIEP